MVRCVAGRLRPHAHGEATEIMDDGILREFLAESFENLAQVEHDLVVLERDPEDRKRLAAIFRAIHTIKGTCGFFGLTKLEALSHAGENLLSRLRTGELHLTPEIAGALLQMVDAIRSILSCLDSTREEGDRDDADLIAILVRLDGAADAAPLADAPPESPHAEVTVPSPVTPRPSRPTPGPPRGGRLDPLILA